MVTLKDNFGHSITQKAPWLCTSTRPPRAFQWRRARPAKLAGCDRTESTEVSSWHPAMCRGREHERETQPGKAQLHSKSHHLAEKAKRSTRTRQAGSPTSCLGRTELIATRNTQQPFPHWSPSVQSGQQKFCLLHKSTPLSKRPTGSAVGLREQVWDKEEGDLAEPMSQGWTLVPVTLVTAASEQSETLCTTSVPAQNFSKTTWAEESAPKDQCAAPGVSYSTGFRSLTNCTGKASTIWDN